ncbi:TetR/AcrR family transcriptional regulator [Nocardia sp. NPDC127579]|uniref:TetR/AcrR family transcriptional regulator n=1 Tax=Nocardia sp. NPDC127579 TaxID=3345402 RepID=UPI00363EE636
MPVGRDALDEKILDVTLERVLQVGIRRSSLDDIARRAGVNRVTIYRRFSGKDKLVEMVLEREAQRMLAEVTERAAAISGIDAQFEDAVLHVLRQTRLHRLVTQLLAVAPDEALSFYTVGGRDMLALGIQYITRILERAQSIGAIDRYDPTPIAELIARLAHSLVLTPAGGVDFQDDDRAREFVRNTIVPLMTYGITRKPDSGG